MITLDTSALFALLNQRDPDRKRLLHALTTERRPYLVPAAVLGEIAYLVEARLGNKVLIAFIEDLATGRLRLDCGDTDYARVGELVDRYSDLPLGLVDAAVVACAERNGGAALTLDRRDFDVVSGEGIIHVLPEPV